MVVAGAGDTAVKEVAKGVAVPQTAPKRKKPHRNLYYCPLPECFEKACMEKITNHIHQYHNLHGEEAHHAQTEEACHGGAGARALEEKTPRNRVWGHQDHVLAGRVSEAMAASVVGKGKGKGKGKEKSKGKGKGKETRKGKGKGKGKERGRYRGRGRREVV